MPLSRRQLLGGGLLTVVASACERGQGPTPGPPTGTATPTPSASTPASPTPSVTTPTPSVVADLTRITDQTPGDAT